MQTSKNLGEFEILVLAAILRLGPEAYGVSIRQEIEERTNRSVSVGALYSTLTRLEKKAYVTSRLGAATSQRGGRSKRFFDMTALGQTQFEKSVSSLDNMLQGVRPWRDTPTP